MGMITTTNSWRTIVLDKDESNRKFLTTTLRKHNFSVIDTNECETAFRHIVTLKPSMFIYGENENGFTCLDIAYFVREIIKARDCKIVHCLKFDEKVKRKMSEKMYIDYFVHKENISEINNIIEQHGLEMIRVCQGEILET